MEGDRKIAFLVGAGAGGLVAVGSLLPWVKATVLVVTISRSGVDLGSDRVLRDGRAYGGSFRRDWHQVRGVPVDEAIDELERTFPDRQGRGLAGRVSPNVWEAQTHRSEGPEGRCAPR